MTRQLQRALTLAAVFAMATMAHADGGSDKKKKFSGHTIQDCLMGHTIQDCVGDRLGGATWVDDDKWIKKITTISGVRAIPAGEKMKMIYDAYADGAIDVIDMPAIVESFVLPTAVDTVGGQELITEGLGGAPIELVPVGSDRDDRVSGRIVLTAQGVPAPGALSLLGLGAMALLGRRRRQG